MNDREKLVELLMMWFLTNGDKNAHPKERIDALAKYLVNGGVTAQKHGRWIMRGGYRYCSECGKRACVTRDSEDFWYTVGTDYCPNCGTKMDLESEQ